MRYFGLLINRLESRQGTNKSNVQLFICKHVIISINDVKCSLCR